MIDFNKIKEVALTNFKDGTGNLYAKIYENDEVKAMLLRVPVGSSIGIHTHADSNEVVRVLKGTMTFYIDNKREEISNDLVHYCPHKGTHSCKNEGGAEALMYCIVSKIKEL